MADLTKVGIIVLIMKNRSYPSKFWGTKSVNGLNQNGFNKFSNPVNRFIKYSAYCLSHKSIKLK